MSVNQLLLSQRYYVNLTSVRGKPALLDNLRSSTASDLYNSTIFAIYFVDLHPILSRISSWVEPTGKPVAKS